MTAELCYVGVMMGDAYGIGIVKDGETGYYKTNWPTVDSYDKAQKWADEMNVKLGVSEEEAWHMVARSMRK